MIEHKCLSPWKGAVAGGLIAFAWSAISWMALPFHGKTLSNIPDPAAVIQGIGGEASPSGVYLLMNDAKGQKAPTDPFIFVSYHAKGWGSMRASMAMGLLMQMVGGFFWTWILGKIPGLTLKDAALYGCFFGLCLGALGVMPNWVWWKFPLGYSLVYVLDGVIAWTIASVVIARWCQADVCELPAAKA
jgi:hypothetical protein